MKQMFLKGTLEPDLKLELSKKNGIGVDRIDHGTNIVEDATLVAYIINNKIGLTCCPVSNGFVTSDMKIAWISEEEKQSYINEIDRFVADYKNVLR